VSRPPKREPKRMRAERRAPTVTPLPPESVSRLNRVPAERFIPPIVLHRPPSPEQEPETDMHRCSNRYCGIYTTKLRCPQCQKLHVA
jgi:hypothetical protein